MSLVALDLDGTLEDSRRDMVSAICRVRSRLGLPVASYEQVVPHVMRGMPHLYQNCFGDRIDTQPLSKVQMEELAALFDEEYRAGIADETRLYPGIRQVLASLNSVAKLAVVTNKPEGLSRLLLTELGILHFFSCVIGGDTASAPKPAPEPLAEALRQSEDFGPAIMVGDSAGDMRCGRAFGASTIWCAWGYHTRMPEPPPDFSIAVPEMLPKVVDGILGSK